MSKRLTDTDKWKKPLLRGLEAPYKLLWLYILDDCDHAGIWQVDIEVAQIRIGEKLDIKKAKEAFAEKIKIFDNGGKWFIQDYIDFQYGTLKAENRVHRSVLELLVKQENKGLRSPFQRAKDKDKDKAKDKDPENVVPTVREIIEYLNATTGKHFPVTDKKSGELIMGLVNSGTSVPTFFKVITRKTAQWLHDPAMVGFLRPSTLFGEKFPEYENEEPAKSDKPKIDSLKDNPW